MVILWLWQILMARSHFSSLLPVRVGQVLVFASHGVQLWKSMHNTADDLVEVKSGRGPPVPQ